MLVTVIKEAKEQGRDIRFIIETHSEIIISRIGQMIATHEFSNENINVLYSMPQMKACKLYREIILF